MYKIEKMKKILIILIFLLTKLILPGLNAQNTGIDSIPNLQDQKFPGLKSKWKGFNRYDFKFENKKVFIVEPSKKVNGKQWIWRARFPGWHTEMDKILLKHGFYIIHINTANQYGSPLAMKTWDNFYDYLTDTYGFSKKVVLEGVSRGGLFIYNWAKLHPERVNCIYAEAPVCDFKSWPAGFGNGKKSMPDWELLKKEYGFRTDKEAKTYLNNPIDNLEKLAKAKVPIMHMIGLNDHVVPPDENTFVLVDRYIKFGGPAYVVPCTKGEHELFGHHFSIETPKLAADFILSNTHLARKQTESKDYQNLRAGLKNCKIRFERTKKGRVAFLGGSITYNRGWRNMVCDYLEESFPYTEFEFIEAGIPSMGSTPGAFRLKRDVISKGKIDLLFEEAAVNDHANGRTNKEQIRAMEGIIRNARKNNPEMDIIMMHFVDPSKMEKYREGKIPIVIKNHETVAKHYNIPSINLAREVTDRIDAAEFSWEKDFKNLHPSPFGQKIYFNSIKTLFENAWSGIVTADNMITQYSLPEKLDQFCYSNGELITPAKTSVNKGWQYIPNWTPKPTESTRHNYTKVPMLVSTDTVSTLKFEFTGSAIGIAIAAGPDAGIIEYSIDNGGWKQKDLFTNWSAQLHLPWYKILEGDLKNDKHILKLRMSNNKNVNSKGNICRIRYFFVNK